MLLEFQSAARNVKTPPAITFYDKEFPQQILKFFPNASKQAYSNGVISLSKLIVSNNSFYRIDCIASLSKSSRNGPTIDIPRWF